jgi:hypothetical protein
MLQFDAAPVVTSIPFCVNGKEFLSLNREMLGDVRRGRKASPARRLIWPGDWGRQGLRAPWGRAGRRVPLPKLT